MNDGRKVNLTRSELEATQDALAIDIETYFKLITSAPTRGERNRYATMCAHAISAYRKTYAWPGGEGIVAEIANAHRTRLADILIQWDQDHG